MKSKLIEALISIETSMIALTPDQIATRRAFYELHDEAELACELAA